MSPRCGSPTLRSNRRRSPGLKAGNMLQLPAVAKDTPAADTPADRPTDIPADVQAPSPNAMATGSAQRNRDKSPTDGKVRRRRAFSSRLGMAAGEGDQAGLLVGVVGDLDPRAVVAAVAQDRVHRLHPDEEAMDLVRVECFVEAGGAGEVPGVDQDVGGAEHVDGRGDGVAPGARVELDGGELGIVEGGEEGAVEGVPGAGGVVVDGGDGGRIDAGTAEEERRHPLDQVADDVAGEPGLAGGGIVPGVGRNLFDPAAEAAGHLAVAVCR